MSFEAAAWAIANTVPETTLQKLVLICLADNHNRHTHECFPSIARLASECRAGRSTIFRALNELEALKLIERDEQHGDGGRRTTSLFHLDLTIGVPERDGGGSRSGTDGGPGAGRTGVPERDGEPGIGTSNNNQGERASARETPSERILTKDGFVAICRKWAANARLAQVIAPPGATAAVKVVYTSWAVAGKVPERDWSFTGKALWDAYCDYVADSGVSRALSDQMVFNALEGKRAAENIAADALSGSENGDKKVDSKA